MNMKSLDLLLNKIERFNKIAQHTPENRFSKAKEFFEKAKSAASNFKQNLQAADLKNIATDKQQVINILSKPLDEIINYNFSFTTSISADMQRFENTLYRTYNSVRSDYIRTDQRSVFDNMFKNDLDLKNYFYHIREIISGRADNQSWVWSNQSSSGTSSKNTEQSAGGNNATEPATPPGEPTEVRSDGDATKAPETASSPVSETPKAKIKYPKIDKPKQRLLNWYLANKMEDQYTINVDGVLGPRTRSAINTVKKHLKMDKLTDNELFDKLNELSGQDTKESDERAARRGEFENKFSKSLGFLQASKNELDSLYQRYPTVFQNVGEYNNNTNILESQPNTEDDINAHYGIIDSIVKKFYQANRTGDPNINRTLKIIEGYMSSLKESLKPQKSAFSFLQNSFISLGKEMDSFKKAIAQGVTENTNKIDSKDPNRGQTSGEISFEPVEVSNLRQSGEYIPLEVKTKLNNLIIDPSVRKFLKLNFNTLKNSNNVMDQVIDRNTRLALNAIKRLYNLSTDDQAFEMINRVDKIPVPKVSVDVQKLVKNYIDRYKNVISAPDFEFEGLFIGDFKKAFYAAKNHYMMMLKQPGLNNKEFISALKSGSDIAELGAKTTKELYSNKEPNVDSNPENKSASIINDTNYRILSLAKNINI